MGAWPDVDALLDRLAPHLLIGPYVVQRPVPIDELAGLAADAVLAAFVFPSLGDDDVQRRVSIDVTDPPTGTLRVAPDRAHVRVRGRAVWGTDELEIAQEARSGYLVGARSKHRCAFPC